MQARRARALFLVVLALTAFQFVFLIADRRVPIGHETGSLYRLQQSFASGHGTPGGWAWFEQGTLFQNVLLLAAPRLQGWSFIPFFHLGMLLEELLLLAGIWLLGSKHFKSPQTLFIVSAATLGSCLWVDHAAANLLPISALPMILYLWHEFLETRSRAALLVAGLLTCLQAMARPPITSLIVPVAAALYAWPLRERLKEIYWRPLDGVGAAAVALLIAIVAPKGSAETGGSTSAVFRNPLESLDFVLGLSPSLDSTAFCGYFTLAFALLALLHAGGKNALGMLALFGAGLFLAGPMPALLRLGVIFLAGFGFDRMQAKELKPEMVGRVGAGLLSVSVLLGALVFLASASSDAWRTLVRAMSWGLRPEAVSPFPADSVLFQELAGMSALMAGLCGAILLLWNSGRRRAPLALALILFLHPLDVFGWKFRMTWMKTAALSTERAATQRLGSDPASVGPLHPAPPAAIVGTYGAGSRLPANDSAPSPLGTASLWIAGGVSLFLMGRILLATARLARGRPR